jgi:hypothetical protein
VFINHIEGEGFASDSELMKVAFAWNALRSSRNSCALVRLLVFDLGLKITPLGPNQLEAGLRNTLADMDKEFVGSEGDWASGLLGSFGIDILVLYSIKVH